jgi:hypothetical protein
LQIPRFFWAPEQYTRVDGLLRAGQTKEQTFNYPLQDEPALYNNNNSSGMCFEADHVWERIKAGGVFKFFCFILALQAIPKATLFRWNGV